MYGPGVFYKHPCILSAKNGAPPKLKLACCWRICPLHLRVRANFKKQLDISCHKSDVVRYGQRSVFDISIPFPVIIASHVLHFTSHTPDCTLSCRGHRIQTENWIIYRFLTIFKLFETCFGVAGKSSRGSFKCSWYSLVILGYDDYGLEWPLYATIRVDVIDFSGRTRFLQFCADLNRQSWTSLLGWANESNIRISSIKNHIIFDPWMKMKMCSIIWAPH